MDTRKLNSILQGAKRKAREFKHFKPIALLVTGKKIEF